MWAATENKNLDIITTLINAGSNINDRNKNGLTALMLAMKNDRPCAVINSLVKAGAIINDRDNSGCTPLILAIKKKAPLDVIECLLKAGANVNEHDTVGPFHSNTGAPRPRPSDGID